MKIKIVLGIWILIGIVVGASFLSDYDKKSTSSDLLMQKISVDSTRIKNLSQNSRAINNEIDTLNNRLASAQKEIQQISSILPEQINPNEIIDALFAQGNLNNVSLIPLTTQDWMELNTGTAKTKNYRISFLAKGSEAALMEIINWIQNSPYPTLVLNSFALTRFEENRGSEGLAAVVKYEATINLALYAK